jgi:hypothetical protein
VRSGFARLTAEVALGHVGIVLGLEVSRLARNNADWHRLIDLAGLSDTLIGDADGIYHPALFNEVANALRSRGACWHARAKEYLSTASLFFCARPGRMAPTSKRRRPRQGRWAGVRGAAGVGVRCRRRCALERSLPVKAACVAASGGNPILLEPHSVNVQPEAASRCLKRP